METLIWVGTGLSLLGLAGLVYCIVAAFAAKRAGLSDADLRARLRALVVWNMASLLLSSLGFVVVITGLLLR
ncbi:hypothetical protein [Palleronia rufa]|uniref:hypothetical protein n=1 Tax=Palleronia rufa TaxID=1530186 RepID=UPI00056D44AF|nr:hypothetical protein [Palleronia rufa]